jgi:hypothetical protein
LIVQRGDPAHYARTLLSLDKIDEYITTSNPNSSRDDEANALADIKASGLQSDSNGMIDVARFFVSTSSTKARQLRYRCSERFLNWFTKSRAVSGTIRIQNRCSDARLQANIYLSPPNAQGFKTHS